MSTTVVIADLFAAITAKVSAVFSTRAQDPFSVQFDRGHYQEITNNLTNKGKAASTKAQRYPLIWLVMDFTERFAELSDYYCELSDLQLIIAVPTNPGSSTAKRIDENFRPRLYPIYEELKEQIASSGFFTVLSPESIPHEKIDRPFWVARMQWETAPSIFSTTTSTLSRFAG